MIQRSSSLSRIACRTARLFDSVATTHQALNITRYRVDMQNSRPVLTRSVPPTGTFFRSQCEERLVPPALIFFPSPSESAHGLASSNNRTPYARPDRCNRENIGFDPCHSRRFPLSE